MSAIPIIPKNHMPIMASVIVSGGAKAIAFYEEAFGAVVTDRFDGPEGVVMHAELQIGGGLLFLADEFPDMGLRSPQSLGAVTSSFTVYVDDPDAIHARAVAAGATETEPVTLGFHGHRSGSVRCPFGHRWVFSKQVEIVDEEEMNRRVAAWMATQG